MTNPYENITRHELEARLRFGINHIEYLHKEAAKKDEKIKNSKNRTRNRKPRSTGSEHCTNWHLREYSVKNPKR